VNTSSVSNRSRYLWFFLTIAALLGIGVFFIPAFIIRPFAYQSPRGLLIAMAVRDRAPLISLVAAIISLLITALLWQSTKKWSRAGLSAIMFLVAASAVMSRLNYFEWMFHPVPTPQFEAESASKLDKGEMILTVRYGADARAYPIREMAYHHILNDVVEGVPIAVTY
jgi:riboflavin transporter FmnP